MADPIPVHAARFNTQESRTQTLRRSHDFMVVSIPPTEYIVPVKWWAYDDDRLDGRGEPYKAAALVSVKAYSPEEARKLVFREWGDYARVGTPVPA